MSLSGHSNWQALFSICAVLISHPVSKRFVFVRHGMTDWNREGRFQGHLDIPLNSTGRQQALSLRRHLLKRTFDRIFTSPLQRAHETAQLIAGAVPIVPDWRIAEIHHGDWQGKTRMEIAAQWPDLWDRWEKEPLSVTPSGGETPERVRQRVEDFLRTVDGRTVLCISHGVVIQTVRTVLLHNHAGENSVTPRNASIHTFSLRKGRVTEYAIEEIV